jgi:epsilon-lactone hydrolase
MQRSTTTSASTDFVVTHPLDPEDAPTVAAMRAMASSTKGMLRGIAAREPFDALMETCCRRTV